MLAVVFEIFWEFATAEGDEVEGQVDWGRGKRESLPSFGTACRLHLMHP
jgi:hypothetical protein